MTSPPPSGLRPGVFPPHLPLGFRLLGIESGHQDISSILGREVEATQPIVHLCEGTACFVKQRASRGVVTSPSTPSFV